MTHAVHALGVPRRGLLVLAGALVLARAGVAAPPERSLPLSRSLPDELAAALATDQPLLVMASLAGCPWCRLVRNNYLAPMHEREGLPVVQVDFLGKTATHAFDGTPATHEALLRQWRVTVAPTVLFFGPQGRELAPRLEGVSENFYSAQLDRRLRQAGQELQQAVPSAAGGAGAGTAVA